MIYNQNNLNIAKIIKKNNFRYSDVLFSKEKTICTDGYRLIEMSIPNDLNIEDFPGEKIHNFEDFCVEAEGIKKIKAPKKQSLPILNNIAVQKIENNLITFQSIEGTHVAKKSSDNFPDYVKALPTNDPIFHFEIDANKLSELLDILGNVNNKVTVKIYGENKPICIEAEGLNQSGRAFMMPMVK